MSKPEMPEDTGDACAPDRTIEGLQQGLRDISISRDEWKALADSRWRELDAAVTHNRHLQSELAAAKDGAKKAAEESEELDELRRINARLIGDAKETNRIVSAYRESLQELRVEMQQAHEWRAAVVAVVALGGSR